MLDTASPNIPVRRDNVNGRDAGARFDRHETLAKPGPRSSRRSITATRGGNKSMEEGQVDIRFGRTATVCIACGAGGANERRATI
jgi:hypothetical protein